MATTPPNIMEIIKKEVDKRIQYEVEGAVARIIKEIQDKKPELLAKLAVDIALEESIMEMGRIIKFEIKER